MNRILFFIATALVMSSAVSCDLIDMYKEASEELKDVLDNYEDRLDLSDEKTRKYLDGKWILSKVGHLSTSNKYGIELVEEDPDKVSSIESIEIDGSTFKFNFKQSTKFERNFWTEDVEHMQTEYLEFDSYTATSGSTTLYVMFDGDVEEFILMDYTNNGFDEYEMYLFGKDILGNGMLNFSITRLVIETGSVCYEFVPAS